MCLGKHSLQLQVLLCEGMKVFAFLGREFVNGQSEVASPTPIVWNFFFLILGFCEPVRIENQGFEVTLVGF